MEVIITKGITIATFISNNEKDNKEIYDIIHFLKDNFADNEVIIFSNYEIKDKTLKNIVTPQMTKYKRIKILLKEAHFNDILCFDNDITMDRENIIKFIKNCFDRDYSIAWGKVKAKRIKGFIPKLINIDKNLSHNYIRPFLWNTKLGISLLGQIFMINKQYFYNNLPDIDTVYDDLMIGTVVRKEKLPIYFVQDVLGYERPKGNITKLLKQRIRWAKGLAETIIYNRKNKVLLYILLHAFSFNLLWIPVYILIYYIFKFNIFCGIIPIIFICYILTDKEIKNIVWSFMYMITFPFVYLVWAFALLFNLIKIPINTKFKRKEIDMDKDFKKLLDEAKKYAKKRILSDYTYCGHVSCALMSGKGNIYTGININSKCALGNCAEQAAILEMLKHGESEIKKIVSYSVKGYIYSPCGKCRELIRMINSNNLKTKVMVAEDRYCTIGELLPEAFERREWENEDE